MTISEAANCLDARVLLKFILNCDDVFLLCNPSIEVPDEFHKLMERRRIGEPIAYIIGKKEFYGIEFFVTPDVLIPRPDSELLVDVALMTKSNRILDLCTGSGCLLISILKNNLDASGVGVDISAAAIEIAKKNSKGMNNVEFLQKNVLDPSSFADLGNFDLVISNPPYIKTDDILSLQTDVRDFEPHIALDGGCDGLNFYPYIAEIATIVNAKSIIVEIGHEMTNEVCKIFPSATIHRDFGEIERVVSWLRSS